MILYESNECMAAASFQVDAATTRKQIVLMPSGTGCIVWVTQGTARLVVGHDRIIGGGGNFFFKKVTQLFHQGYGVLSAWVWAKPKRIFYCWHWEPLCGAHCHLIMIFFPL
jgi:hypothetical protein